MAFVNLQEPNSLEVSLNLQLFEVLLMVVQVLVVIFLQVRSYPSFLKSPNLPKSNQLIFSLILEEHASENQPNHLKIV